MYQTYFKFKAKPFRLNPDHRFFYSSKTHKRAMSYLRYGIEQGEGFIIITGDVGTGKTTLVNRLLKSINPNNIVTAHIVNSQLQPADLLRMASAEFGLEYKNLDKASLLQNLHDFFRASFENNKRVLLVVDEAQNLTAKSLEELRMLSNLHLNGRQLVQSFLLGQKEFRNTLRSTGYEQLRQRIIATYHLRPLDGEETREYILHRLNLVGWKNDPGFDPSVFGRIYQCTKGLPRKINLLCDRLLLHACIEELHQIDDNTLGEVLADIEGEYWGEGMIENEIEQDIEHVQDNTGT